ncbi:MAG: 50S ribosomal protein L25 [Actinobacteria bacterium]|nr:50S ribosomal protein L25 [Actinomycetota bacterium]
MENLIVKASKRSAEELKKNASRRLRREGYIPGVLYGLNLEPVCIKVNTKELKELLKGKSPTNVIFDLIISENGNRKETAIIKEIQRDVVTRDVLHLDFMRIEMQREVETTVPIVIVGEEEAIGVKEQGGVVQHGLRELHIECLPKDIPEKIEYDISDLKMGDVVKVSDLKLSERIKVISHPEEVIVSIIHATRLREEEVAGEEIEEEEAVKEPEVISKQKESKEESSEK